VSRCFSVGILRKGEKAPCNQCQIINSTRHLVVLQFQLRRFWRKGFPRSQSPIRSAVILPLDVFRRKDEICKSLPNRVWEREWKFSNCNTAHHLLREACCSISPSIQAFSFHQKPSFLLSDPRLRKACKNFSVQIRDRLRSSYRMILTRLLFPVGRREEVSRR